MSKFIEYANKRLLNEIFGSFSYKVPEDKEEQLYDFYMLTRLKQQWPVKYLQHRKPAPTPRVGGDMENDDKVDYMLEEVAHSLLPYLKQNMLDAVFFAMTSEFRHVKENESNTNYVELKEMDITDEEMKQLKKYATRMGQYEYIPGMMRPAVIDGNLLKTTNKERAKSYISAIKSMNDKYSFVVLMEKIFNKGKWASGYGGNAWGKIAEAWRDLYHSKSQNEQIIAIDHLYDIQHNTDTVFNKLESYLKNKSFNWLKRALNLKNNIKSIHELIPRVSHNFKPLALRAIKVKFGKTQEDYEKESGHKLSNYSDFKNRFDTYFDKLDGEPLTRIARLLISYLDGNYDITSGMKKCKEIYLFNEDKIVELFNPNYFDWNILENELYKQLEYLTKIVNLDLNVGLKPFINLSAGMKAAIYNMNDEAEIIKFVQEKTLYSLPICKTIARQVIENKNSGQELETADDDNDFMKFAKGVWDNLEGTSMHHKIARILAAAQQMGNAEDLFLSNIVALRKLTKIIPLSWDVIKDIMKKERKTLDDFLVHRADIFDMYNVLNAFVNPDHYNRLFLKAHSLKGKSFEEVKELYRDKILNLMHSSLISNNIIEKEASPNSKIQFIKFIKTSTLFSLLVAKSIAELVLSYKFLNMNQQTDPSSQNTDDNELLTKYEKLTGTPIQKIGKMIAGVTSPQLKKRLYNKLSWIIKDIPNWDQTALAALHYEKIINYVRGINYNSLVNYARYANDEKALAKVRSNCNKILTKAEINLNYLPTTIVAENLRKLLYVRFNYPEDVIETLANIFILYQKLSFNIPN